MGTAPAAGKPVWPDSSLCFPVNTASPEHARWPTFSRGGGLPAPRATLGPPGGLTVPSKRPLRPGI